MQKLFIDDVRVPSDVGFDNSEFLVARSAREAQELIVTKKFDFISFDHDLGENVATGMDVAKWLCSLDRRSGGEVLGPNFKFHVHSANPVGAENIRSFIFNYLRVKNEQEVEAKLERKFPEPFNMIF